MSLGQCRVGVREVEDGSMPIIEFQFGDEVITFECERIAPTHEEAKMLCFAIGQMILGDKTNVETKYDG